MNRQVKIFAGVIAMALAVGTVMSAQVPATITMRSGETMAVTMMDLGGQGFQVRVNGVERNIPKDQVAMVDFGGNVTPQKSWFEGMTSHLVVFKNGDTLKTEWTDIGGAMPLILRVNNGSGERELTTNEVARIYLVAPAESAPVAPAPVAGSVDVNANTAWTSAGITVRSGEFIRFAASGEIRYGAGANDVAAIGGNPNAETGSLLFRRLPVTSMPVGGLIGKVGNGRAFSIGSTTQGIRMPASGQLFLGVNDLTFNDNSGAFRVVVTRGQ